MTRQVLNRWLVLTVGSIVIMCGALWTTPSLAETAPSPSPLKGFITKRANEDRSTAQMASDMSPPGIPDDPLGRGVPRSTVRKFLAATGDRNFELAAEYLDLRNFSAATDKRTGAELARQLKIILDRALWIDPDLLSAEPQGHQDDHLHPARDRVGTISADDAAYDIFLQRVPQEDGAPVWKFAGVTVAEIPELYRKFGYGWLEEVLPSWLFDVSLLGIHLWMWIALVGLGILLYPAAIVITWFVVFIVRRFRADLGQQVELLFTGPLRLLIWGLLIKRASEIVGPSIALQLLREARIVQFIALVWLLMRTVDLVVTRGRATLDRQGFAAGLLFFKPVVRLLKVVALIVALLLWLESMGFSVTTLELAGLTISGVAVALASQKTLENFLGAFTLAATQPVRVGDFCRFGTTLGTVEEIGLRATRVRTLERAVVTIANSDFLGLQVHNLSKRDRYWYNPTLRLRYETTPDQIRYILIEIRKMLYAHPKVVTEPLHIRFKGFAQYSLDLEVFAYIAATDYHKHFEVAGDLNLRIMDIVAAAGTDFALPAEIEHSLPGKPFDEQRAQAIEAEVKEWKAQRALYLPDFPKETIDAISGSLDYPPEGSPQYSRMGTKS